MEKLKILIVEDENIVARDIKLTLTNFGYEVVDIVSTAEVAYEKAKDLKPDLILMDIMLKGPLDGIEAAKKIKEDLHVPIIYLTAYADEETLSSAKLTEPFGYLIKPFEDAELHTTIQMAVYRFNMEKQLKDRENLLSTILNSISEAVIVTDENDKITFINTEAENLMGFTYLEALGKNFFEIYRILEDKNQSTVNQFIQDKIKASMYTQRASQLLISKNKKLIPVELFKTKLADQKGLLNGYLFVIRDITKQLDAEILNFKTLEDLRNVLNGIVQAMAFIVEKRDPYTAGHQRRVSDLARTIATKLGFPAEKVNGIRLAGMVHDIGKITIPAEILSKPGLLTQLEYNLIKRHPEAGYEILKQIELPWPIAEIVYQHHERLDGSGYPLGLKAEQISPEAKIIAVADVMEAMSSHRPYRPALGLEKALAELKIGRDLKYDPQATDVCIELFSQKKYSFS